MNSHHYFSKEFQNFVNFREFSVEFDNFTKKSYDCHQISTKGHKMNALIQFRIDGVEKQKLEQTLKAMGLDIATAFKLFAAQVIRQRRIPFEVVADESYAPNDETIAAIKRLENNEGVQSLTLDELVKIAKKSSANA